MAWKHLTISQLEMTNFKRFYGTHKIDLRTEPELDKTLILIGGDNGRGKTSIHEAINYALYEDDDLPGIHTRPNYFKAVSDRLNRRALDEGNNDFGVAIDLIATDNGASREIRIERTWDVNVLRRSVNQANLRIYENGRPVDFIEESPLAYQDFLRNLLPPRIAPFFFFDGERIQDFADDENHERKMVDAIEDILPITVYKSLRNDLKTYVVDHLEKREVRTRTDDEFYRLLGDKEAIELKLEEKRDRVADNEREIEEIGKERKRVEDELRRIASPHASQRDELITEKTRLEREVAEVKAEIERGFEPLPLLLAGDLRNQLREDLTKEQADAFTPQRVEKLQQQIDHLKKQVLIDPTPHIPNDIRLTVKQLEYYSKRFDEVCCDLFGFKDNQAFAETKIQPLLHDIGETGRRKILERLDQVEKVGSVLREAINRRERLMQEARDVQTKFLSTSDDPHVTELIKRNNSLSQQLGSLEEENRTLNAEIQRLEADLATRSNQIERKQEERKATSEAKRTIKLAQRARRGLDEYIRRLAPEKIALLRGYMDEMYTRLKKPEDPVRYITIDPDTWQIILLDEQERPLEKRVFSAGMREMYALALLWALSKASGKQLPIVIDTPVGRLDTINRRTLFENYLPSAGHQVIVLSTDTEVDVEWAKRLAPYVARQYRLDHESSTDSTVIKPGYFF